MSASQRRPATSAVTATLRQCCQMTKGGKLLLRRRLVVTVLLVSICVVIFSALVSQHGWDQQSQQPTVHYQHQQQQQQRINDVTRDDPIKFAKRSFSLLSADKSENSTTKNLTHLCFPFNSLTWLNGPRLGNNNDSLLYNTTSVRETLLWESSASYNDNGASSTLGNFFSPHGLAKTLLSQTICHENSRFLNLTTFTDLRMWSLRLIFLSLHIHQHEPAMKEARHRYSWMSPTSLSAPSHPISPCHAASAKHHIGVYDYECPTAKFLVVAMGRQGLGSVMRLGAVNFYIAGISTGRVVLFINNYHRTTQAATNKSKIFKTTNVPKFLQDPWMHASCSRHDVQCFFWPSSPCVVTEQEMERAYFLTKGETRHVFRMGAVPPNHENDRVILMDITLRPQRCPENLFPTLRNISLSKIIEPLKQHQSSSVTADAAATSSHHLSLKHIQFLEQAADKILDVDGTDPNRTYYYFGQASKAHHAMLFYAMRPNLYYTQRMKEIIAKSVPSDVNPEFSLGLPIRGSDKCLTESECLPFATYMKLMGYVWTKQFGNESAIGNVILTTESGKVVREKIAFESNQTMVRSLPFSLRFITNQFDVLQGTGLPRNFLLRYNQSGTPYSQDDIMLSAVTSLKVQLMAKYTMGNCCSNFHLLLFDFLREGCGATASENVHQCLQEHENPEFRVCCLWSDSEECKLRKELKNAKDKSTRKRSPRSSQQQLQLAVAPKNETIRRFTATRKKKRVVPESKN